MPAPTLFLSGGTLANLLALGIPSVLCLRCNRFRMTPLSISSTVQCFGAVGCKLCVVGYSGFSYAIMWLRWKMSIYHWGSRETLICSSFSVDPENWRGAFSRNLGKVSRWSFGPDINSSTFTFLIMSITIMSIIRTSYVQEILRLGFRTSSSAITMT